MTSQVYGITLIIIGLVYVIKPNIFRRWIWKKTAISQQKATPKQNIIYMRILGVILLAIGVYQILKYYQYI